MARKPPTRKPKPAAAVQKEINKKGETPATQEVASPATPSGAQSTHALVELGLLNRLIPFLHGHNSDMAKDFANALSNSGGVTVTPKEPTKG